MVEVANCGTYDWPSSPTFIQDPHYFQSIGREKGVIRDIKRAPVLALLGNLIIADHISPVGTFEANTPAGQYLTWCQVSQRDFNSYGSRRANHEIMRRGTLVAIRIRNEMLANEQGGVEGGYRTAYPSPRRPKPLIACEVLTAGMRQIPLILDPRPPSMMPKHSITAVCLNPAEWLQQHHQKEQIDNSCGRSPTMLTLIRVGRSVGRTSLARKFNIINCQYAANRLIDGTCQDRPSILRKSW